MNESVLIEGGVCYALPRTTRGTKIGAVAGAGAGAGVFNLSKCVANVYLINEMNYCTTDIQMSVSLYKQAKCLLN